MTTTVTCDDFAVEHKLVHVRFSDGRGRLTPACSCGWYSHDGSHWRFERHLAKVRESS